MTNDIVRHIERVYERLSRLDAKRQSQFAAWCVNGLINDESIRSNLVELTGVTTAVETVQAAVDYVWTHDEWSTDQLDGFSCGIENMDWDVENPLVEAPASQGSIELLGAATNMLSGVGGRDVRAIANCAEHVINWFNTRADFPVSQSGDLEAEELENEYVRQEQFLEELEGNQIGASDLSKFRVFSE